MKQQGRYEEGVTALVAKVPGPECLGQAAALIGSGTRWASKVVGKCPCHQGSEKIGTLAGGQGGGWRAFEKGVEVARGCLAGKSLVQGLAQLMVLELTRKQVVEVECPVKVQAQRSLQVEGAGRIIRQQDVLGSDRLYAAAVLVGSGGG